VPASYARVAFEAHNTASLALITNVVHLEVDTLSSPVNWASVANDIYTWLGTLWNNVLEAGDHFDQVVVTDENYAGSSFGQGVHNAGTAGARVANNHNVAPAACMVAGWRTATAKRYARGHIFFPPAYDASILGAGGTFTAASAYVVACNAFATSYAAGHTSGSTSYVPIVFSRTRAKLNTLPFTFPVTAYTLQLGQHWLRSRNTSP
jgi:hypothetical protein